AVLEVVFLLAQLAVVLVFLVIVVYSKHLHIFLAPVNVLFSRRPHGLGPLEPMRSGGKVLDFEDADPDADVFSPGKIEDFTRKGLWGPARSQPGPFGMIRKEIPMPQPVIVAGTCTLTGKLPGFFKPTDSRGGMAP